MAQVDEEETEMSSSNLVSQTAERRTTKTCPNSKCGESVYFMAHVCEACGYDFLDNKLPQLRANRPSKPASDNLFQECKTTITKHGERTRLYCQDALEALRTLPHNSIDSLVTDPPAGIGFMGKEWDGDKGGKAEWVAWLASILAEARRVLKPGAHCFVWALPRTSHWTMNAIEDAGFEIRDRICAPER